MYRPSAISGFTLAFPIGLPYVFTRRGRSKIERAFGRSKRTGDLGAASGNPDMN
jgi:hypothetical protein